MEAWLFCLLAELDEGFAAELASLWCSTGGAAGVATEGAGSDAAGAGLEPAAGLAAEPASLLDRPIALEMACLQPSETSSLCCLRQARILPPPDGTPAQSFCTSEVSRSCTAPAP